MRYIEETDDFILVCWTHPTNKTDDEVQHYNSTIYEKFEENRAIFVYEQAVRMNNTPAFIYHNGRFIRHSGIEDLK